MDVASKIMLASVFVQVGLTLWSILSMGFGRVNALKTTELHIRDVALSSTKYPEDVLKLSNNMQNQFETPVLLYAGVGIALAIGVVNWVMTGAAVAYVLFRFWHRWIHVSHNNVPKRFKVYVYGLVALCVFWLSLAVEVFLL